MTWVVKPIPNSSNGREIACPFLSARFLHKDVDPCRLTVTVAEQSNPATDYFEFEFEDDSQSKLVLEGDFSHVSYIGAAAPKSSNSGNVGHIEVFGSVGPMCGHRMRRGMIIIHGDAGPWLGAMMIAGTIVVGGTVEPGVMTGARRGTLLHRRPLHLDGQRFTKAIRTPFPFAGLLGSYELPAEMRIRLGKCETELPRIQRGDLSVDGLAELIELTDE